MLIASMYRNQLIFACLSHIVYDFAKLTYEFYEIFFYIPWDFLHRQSYHI